METFLTGTAWHVIQRVSLRLNLSALVNKTVYAGMPKLIANFPAAKSDFSKPSPNKTMVSSIIGNKPPKHSRLVAIVDLLRIIDPLHCWTPTSSTDFSSFFQFPSYTKWIVVEIVGLMQRCIRYVPINMKTLRNREQLHFQRI